MLKDKPTLPCLVTITRISPRSYDHDNFVASAKGLRDILSDLVIPGLAPGQADADPRITWHYKQEKGKQSVRIQIEDN